MWETLEVTKKENFALLTLNRPEALNALNTRMALELVAAVELPGR